MVEGTEQWARAQVVPVQPWHRPGTRESRPFRKVWSVILLICEMGNSLDGRERCCRCDGALKLSKVKDAEAPRGPHHTLLFVRTSRTWGVGTWL